MSSVATTAYIAAAAVSLVVTFLLMPHLIRTMKARGMVGRDQNKFDKREVAEMGGVAVVAGFFAGAVVLMAFDSFRDQGVIPNQALFLAGLIAALGAAFVGSVDDVFDLRQRTKAFLPVLFGLPMAFLVADQTIHLPGGVVIAFGWLMIPIIAFMISAGANASNMLEGFNGLGAGLGLIAAAAFTILAFYSGRPTALLLLMPYMGTTVAFLWYNRLPSRVFPGDTFTLFSGATIVAAAIMVDLKEVGALLFIPMIIEFFVKARHHFSPECYGTPKADGTLTHTGPIGSLTHLSMMAGANTERKVVWSLWGAEALIATLVVAIILF